MNNLNSVLVEGQLIRNPRMKNKETCTFQIVSKRYYKLNDKYEEEKSFFNVECISTKLSRVCIEFLEKGKCVRIIGRLKGQYGEVKIMADHVEFKPVK